MLRVCFILLPFCFWAREYVGFWFFFFFHILSQFLLPPQSTVFGAGQLVNDPKEIAYRYFQGEFFLDLFLVIPLPQIWICRIMPKNLDAFGNNYANILLHIAVFFQYIPKLGRLLPVLARLKPWLFLVQLTFLINLLTFMLAGHVVGISWYFLGLQRVTSCLRDACGNSDTCRELIYCDRADAHKIAAWRVDASACFQEGGYPHQSF